VLNFTDACVPNTFGRTRTSSLSLDPIWPLSEPRPIDAWTSERSTVNRLETSWPNSETLSDDETLLLINSFEPEPLYQVLKERGFQYETTSDGPDLWYIEIQHD